MIRHLLIALCAAGPISAQEPDRTAICQELSNDLVRDLGNPPHSRDYRLYRIEAFVSEKLDTCIHIEVRLFGAEVMVRDMTEAVLKNGTGRFPPLLLHCDESGVDEANIEAVRTHGGTMTDVPFDEWLTDGQGGLPRTLRTPEKPYTRDDCEAALGRWMAKWR